MLRSILLLAVCACGTPAATPVGHQAPPPPSLPSGVMASNRKHPANLVADATGAYWSEKTETEATLWHVTRATHEVVAVVHAPGEITAIELDRGTVYYGHRPEDGDSELVRLRDGRTEQLAHEEGAFTRIAIDATGVYWTDGGGTFVRLPPGATTPVTVASSVEYSYADALALDDRFVYWSNELDDTPKRIYRVAKTGGDVGQVNAQDFGAWEVGGGMVYFSAGKKLWKVPNAPSDAPPVALGAGELVGRVGDRLYAVEGGALHERSIATNASRALHVPITDEITGTALVADGVWLVRDPDRSDDDAATATIVFAGW